VTFIESYPTLKQARKAAAEWKRKWKYNNDTIIKKERIDSLFKKGWVFNLYQK
jgi:hypothetical protein